MNRTLVRAMRVAGVLVSVSGGPLLSRLASLLLLVYAARVLKLEEFGLYAVGISTAVGIANIATIGLGDMAAGTAVRAPQKLRRTSQVCAVVALLTFGVAVGAILIQGRIYAVTAATSFAILLISTAINMYFMQILRGLTTPTVAVAFGYYIPSVARLLILATPGPHVSFLLLAELTALTAAVPAVVAAIFALLRLRGSDPLPASAQIYRNFTAALAIGLSYFLLNQADLLALSWFVDIDTGAQFIPQMRIFEALGAIAIASKFMSTKRSFSEAGDHVRRTITYTAIGYAAAAIPAIFLGRFLAEYMLGSDSMWSEGTASILAVAYLFSSVSSLLIQFQVAARNWRQIIRAAIVLAIVVIVGFPVAAINLGVAGIAIADVIAFAVWSVMLVPVSRIATRERRANAKVYRCATSS